MSFSNANDGDKRQRLIQWDEVTIAEHDRERGSRQKIDEAPTPFRYLSESDQSECESCASTDSADVTTKRKSRKNKSNESATYISPPSNQGNSVGDSWEAINAKLHYEKHLQDIHDEHELNKDLHSEEIHQELVIQRPTEFGEIVPSTVGGNNQKGGNNGNTQKVPKSIFIKSHDTASAASAATTTSNSNGSSNGTTNTTNIAGASSANGSSGGSSGVGSALHHHHPHGQHSIHFSNSPQVSPKPSHNGLFAGINGSIGGNSHTPQAESQFKNKRAGHYNEFKVLQAMRNKLAAEDSDEGEDN